MEENYVSLEVAKLLKEKGFDKPCKGYYCFSWNENKYKLFATSSKFKNGIDVRIAAPTLYAVHKWLIDVHGICIVIKPHYSAKHEIVEFEYEIYGYIDKKIEEAEPIRSEKYYEDYSQCLNCAILDTLESFWL